MMMNSSLPSPIPTAKGSRSASNPILSERIDKSVQVPLLNLPQKVQRRQSSKPVEVNYESLVLREGNSLRGMLRSVKEFGVFGIVDHGIFTHDLRLALAKSERIFGLTVECCGTSAYEDHEKLVWCDGHDEKIMEEAGALIGERNFQIFRRKIANTASQLRTIAEELAHIIFEISGKTQHQEPIELKGATLSIYRYHRANIIDRNSSEIRDDRTVMQESSPFALCLTLYLLEDIGEFCLESDSGDHLYFNTSPDTIVVTMGNEIQELSYGNFKSAQAKLKFNPFLHTNRASFSIEQRWTTTEKVSNVGKSNKIISVTDQIMVIIVL